MTIQEYAEMHKCAIIFILNHFNRRGCNNPTVPCEECFASTETLNNVDYADSNQYLTHTTCSERILKLASLVYPEETMEILL